MASPLLKPKFNQRRRRRRSSKTLFYFRDSLIFFIYFFTLLPSIVSAFSFTDMEIGGYTGGRKKDDLFPEILRDEAVYRLNELGKAEKYCRKLRASRTDIGIVEEFCTVAPKLLYQVNNQEQTRTTRTIRKIMAIQVSDAEGHLERTFLSLASKSAASLIRSWMEDAGLRTWVDQMGNVHGRVEGVNKRAEALLVGSHLDTVIDAGIFDGSLGIVCALSALKVLKIRGKLETLKRPVEVIAFSDEEGVRFQSTFLGSAAIAGTRPASALQISDKSGMTVQDVLKKNSFEATEESYLQLKYDPKSVWGYIEVHIEQGPVLESLGLPLGVVKGIAGQTRLKVTVRGSQGHAGTVPMAMRQDPMAASAELILLLESICKHPESFVTYDGQCNGFAMESLAGSLVCTVGEISSWPGASNVIPGQVMFTVDLRTMDNMAREAIIFELSNRMYQICEQRSVSCIIERKHDAEAVICDLGLSSQLKSSAYSALKRVAGEIEDEVPVLMSGAGHDAMAMSHLTKVGMLFVRCRGGISHSPKEHVLDDDVWVAGLAILEFLETNL